MQLPRRGPAPSGSHAGLSFAVRGGGCRLLSVPTPHPLPLWLATCPFHPGMSPFVCFLLISYVLPQCVCMWGVVWCVCGRAPPECAAAAHSVCHEPAPARAGSSLPRGPTVDLSLRWWLTRLAACSLPPSPAPLSFPLAPPLVGVCMVPCVTCACGATTPGSACYRMAAGGVLGGDAPVPRMRVS